MGEARRKFEFLKLKPGKTYKLTLIPPDNTMFSSSPWILVPKDKVKNGRLVCDAECPICQAERKAKLLKTIKERS